jgi:hypothetical protein
MGLDPAGSGTDKAVLTWRHGGWYGPLVSISVDKPKDNEDSNEAAERAMRRASEMVASVVIHRRAEAPVIVDMGGGYGGDVTTRMKDNGIAFQAFNGANKSAAMSRDHKLRYINARAEAWWKFREELNPDQEGGSAIALPNDSELLADLTAPTFEIKSGGVQIESKDDIKKRLGRSPDKGDAVVMCLAPGHQAVQRQVNTYSDGPKRHKPPRVHLGYASAKRSRR